MVFLVPAECFRKFGIATGGSFDSWESYCLCLTLDFYLCFCQNIPLLILFSAGSEVRVCVIGFAFREQIGFAREGTPRLGGFPVAHISYVYYSLTICFCCYLWLAVWFFRSIVLF